MFKQVSGVFMGTSPAPDLANAFAFFHEYRFLSHIIDEYILTTQYGGPATYSREFIVQFALGTKRYIDDILTVSPGHVTGPSLEEVIFQGGTFGGMYPKEVLDFEGQSVPTTVSILREQRGSSLNFLDMTILQQVPGISQVRMYYKRDDMPTLRHYIKFPYVETILSVRCKYATLHSQLCRFAYRCSTMSYCARAAANLIRDMHSHGYDKAFLRRKVYNFSIGLLGELPASVLVDVEIEYGTGLPKKNSVE